MRKKILLIEPNYSNKYPPIGLMKISTYHRMLKDKITFFKGDIKDFILNEVTNKCIAKLNRLETSEKWYIEKQSILKYIQTNKNEYLTSLKLDKCLFKIRLKSELDWFRKYYKNKQYINDLKWDRIYIATLFTFYWDITVKTINDSKILVDNISEIKVGGIMASLLPNEIKKSTGITPVTGLLDRPGIFDMNKIVIDDLPLDYSILDEIDYEYPAKNAYFTFMTKGCTRKCTFCSVPKLEPTYKEKIPTKNKFIEINNKFGEQRNLLLMDNNVLASPKFPEIIQEIKDMGFTKNATFYEPNQLSIAVRNIRKRYNVRGNIKKAYKLIYDMFLKLCGKDAIAFASILNTYRIVNSENVTEKTLLKAYPKLKEIYEKNRKKTPVMRYVDFNQGTDCRYINEENMKLLSEIPIRPLRIAFDYIGLKDKYVNAVELAAKYGINKLSNYILYNFTDSPSDLYERLKININLSEKLNIHIFSFPMKYIPLFGENAKHRGFVSAPKWNIKFVRAIQAMLNVSKGIVAPGRDFFYRTFGKTIEEYFEILYMPESYIIYRKIFEDAGWTNQWKQDFNNLDKDDLVVAKILIEKNQFYTTDYKVYSKSIQKLMSHYTVGRSEVKSNDYEIRKLRKKYDKMISKDIFIKLTLTYDFENSGKNYA